MSTIDKEEKDPKVNGNHINNNINCKQVLKKQVTCAFEMEKMGVGSVRTEIAAEKTVINRTNSYIEKDGYINDSTCNKFDANHHNHLGHCGKNVNLSENKYGHLQRSDECENLAEQGLNTSADNQSHNLKRTFELENLINSEINNDD